jgi:hypothetical protein
MQRFLQNLETRLTDLFSRAPALTANGKNTIVEVWPWVALILGLLQLVAAWGLWHLIQVSHTLHNLAVHLSSYYGGHIPGPNMFNEAMMYVGIIVLITNTALLLMAFPKLRARSKVGWRLLFCSALLNGLYGLFQLCMDGRGFGSFVVSLLETVVVLYFLFQVRSLYAEEATPAAVTTATEVSARSFSKKAKKKRSKRK